MKETEEMADYYLRGIPHNLLCAAKHRAIDSNMTLRQLIIMAIREHVMTPAPVDGVTETPAPEVIEC